LHGLIADSLITQAPLQGSLACATPRVVLDTNVVLDWLVFRNPHCDLLKSMLEENQLQWIATAVMWDELADVLTRGCLDAWQPDLQAVKTQWTQRCQEVAPPEPAQTAALPRCTDTDDQKFIDLAISHQAHWLLSRDRAVLRLASRAAAWGLTIAAPIALVPQTQNKP
jgi:putative PIN family toxin of toxin-antitoxin system